VQGLTAWFSSLHSPLLHHHSCWHLLPRPTCTVRYGTASLSHFPDSTLAALPDRCHALVQSISGTHHRICMVNEMRSVAMATTALPFGQLAGGNMGQDMVQLHQDQALGKSMTRAGYRQDIVHSCCPSLAHRRSRQSTRSTYSTLQYTAQLKGEGRIVPRPGSYLMN
jgi:hypothetical protein